jgi:hypothetical protein
MSVIRLIADEREEYELADCRRADAVMELKDGVERLAKISTTIAGQIWRSKDV